MERCMSNKVMEREYENTNQRYAVCVSQYENKKSKR